MRPRRAISKRQTQAVALAKAMGPIRVFAVGVDDYDETSAYATLKTCSSDARAIIDCFRDVHQLNADKGGLSLCTSRTSPKLPTRNTIIGELTKFAKSASEGDRLLFYFSGHGDRAGSSDEEFFLVPQDAYDNSPDALIPFRRVLDILDGSAARQKIVMLDACFCGVDVTHLKLLAAKISRKAVLEYVKKTTGVAILTATTSDLASTQQSPNPKLSLFTHFLARALRGQEPDSLDAEAFLTIDSLYQFLSTVVPRTAYSYDMREQLPTLKQQTTGVIVLGDFSASIINPESLDLYDSPARELSFEDTYGVRVEEILTRIKNFGRLTVEQIVYAANTAMAEYAAAAFGRLVPRLRKTLSWSQGSVVIEGECLKFPGGSLTYRFESEDKRRGDVRRTLELDHSWFERPEQILIIVQTLELAPEVMTIHWGAPIDVESVVPGLEARQWQIMSERPDEVEARNGGAVWTFTSEAISIRGFSPGQLFGDGADGKITSLVGQALAVFAQGVDPLADARRLPPRKR
jgi:hypothetical protein